MMGGGFSADEEALSDLRIRESQTHKVKGLLLALRENADPPRTRPGVTRQESAVRKKSERFQGSSVEDAVGALERKFRDRPIGGVSRRPFAAKRKDRFRRDFGDGSSVRPCSSESKA